MEGTNEEHRKKFEKKVDDYAGIVGKVVFYVLATIIGLVFAWNLMKVVVGMF